MISGLLLNTLSSFSPCVRFHFLFALCSAGSLLCKDFTPAHNVFVLALTTKASIDYVFS